MSIPVFIHVMANGDVWFSNHVNDIPTGTVLGSFRVNSDAKFQKIGTLSGTCNSNLSATGTTGRWGSEKT